MEIHLLGYRTTTGAFFHKIASDLDLKIISYSRNKDMIDDKSILGI